jgi:protein involved in sex pheromone biosynthesis
MKKTLLVGLLLAVAMLSGCAEFGSSIYHSDSDSSNHSGHSHH